MTNRNAEITGYKDSPLGKIPSDWEVKTLNKVGVVITGNTPSRSNPEYWNGQYCWASAQDFKSKYISNTTEKLTDKGVGVARILPIGSLLITCIASIGKNAIAKVPMASNQQINAIITNQKHYNEWLYYFLENNKQRLQTLAGKTAVPIVSKSTFEKFKIIVPLLPEQTCIAELLSVWDKAISNVQATIEQVELRNKWLMSELLTGKRRLKGFGGEWKEMRMKNVFDRVTRKNTENNTNVVTISAQRGFVRQTDFFNKNIASEITDNYFLVEKGEFCYNKSYSNGYPWGATKRLNDYEKAVVTTLYICFKIKDLKRSSGDFFEHFFERNSLDRGLTKIAHEGGRAHGLLNVTPSDFFDLKITIPGFEEQTAIAQVLQAAANEVQVLRSKLDKLKEQKKGLMQVLLTGKKRLNLNLQD